MAEFLPYPISAIWSIVDAAVVQPSATRAAAGVGLRNYIVQVEISLTSGAVAPLFQGVAIYDGQGPVANPGNPGAILWQMDFNTPINTDEQLVLPFLPVPIQGSPNTPITIAFAGAVPGGDFATVNAQGFVAP